MRGQIRSKTNEKDVNRIENWDENWYKMENNTIKNP